MVSLVPNVTEMLLALGLTDRLVGVSVHDDLPQVAHLPRVADLEVDYEKLVTLRPDLVVTDPSFLDPSRRMDDLGIPRLEVSVNRVGDFPAVLRRLGKELGATSTAEAVAQRFETRLGELELAGSKQGERPRVLILIWADPPVVAGGESFLGDALRIAGGVNVFKELKGYPTVSQEQLVARSIDLVITSTELEDLPRPLSGLPTLALEANSFSRPGLSSLETIEAIQGRILQDH